LVNWGLVLYVSRLFRAHNALPDLLGRRWLGVRQLGVDLALAFAVFTFVEAFEALLACALGAGRNAALAGLRPSTEAERLTWILVAVSVGFCEEVVYRGYLQRQLSALAGRPSFGIVLSALLFGVAHAEQGVGSAVRIAGYGLALGVLARARRSLLPGIVCHVAIDLASAFVR
jgi:membrane protease YdiL (CAAX protease family)